MLFRVSFVAFLFAAFAAVFSLTNRALADSYSFVHGRFANEYGERQYRLYLPRGYDPAAGRALPVVVLLHGCGQVPEDFFTGVEIGRVADRERFFVLLPMQERIHNSMACWNWYLPEHQRRNSGEPSIVVGMIDQIARDYKVDRTRVFLAGFSGGAAMASSLASCYPDVFAAVGIHSGVGFHAATTLTEAFQAMNSGGLADPNEAGEAAYRCSGFRDKAMPVAIFHGTRDNVVNPVNAQQIFDEFAQYNDFADNGRDDDSINSSQTTSETGQVTGGYSYRVDTLRVRGKPLVQRVMVQSMPHAWSGGSGFQYMDPAGPEASELFWRFFQQHRR